MTGPSITGEQLSTWCAQRHLPGYRRPLSDASALLIASGHLDERARAVVVRRVARGLPLPSVNGGFGELARIQRAIDRMNAVLSDGSVPAVVSAVIRSRLNVFIRRRADMRRAVTSGKAVFASGVRGIRRERRDGVHLELDDRDRLFEALSHTPTAHLASDESGLAATERAAAAVGRVVDGIGSAKIRTWVAAVLGESGRGTDGDAYFIDGYDVALYLVGESYDRVVGSPAWYSEYFDVHRTQIDLHAEVADVAADILAVRQVRVDLERSRRNGGFDADFRRHLQSREDALRPVWTQLVERIRALAGIAEVMESAAAELHILHELARTATIDERIDRLVARSGNGEISVDNTDRLREQLRSGEEQLRIYRDILQGAMAGLPPRYSGEKPSG